MCMFCNQYGTMIKSADVWPWEEPDVDGQPYVRGTAMLIPCSGLEVNLEMGHQIIVGNNHPENIYPPHVWFEIKYCPMCGRKLGNLDKELLDTYHDLKD